jgi:S-formylglutathione hydrolase FrmB
MARLVCDFRSESLERNTSMTVILPEQADLSKVPVVYLLHGVGDDGTGWVRYTSVERYARMKGIALVVPDGQRSFYTDMAYGPPYFRFVHDELRETCMRFFGFSPKRELTYVMGLSMGGYGALKCALSTPDRYAGCAAFSAVTDIVRTVAEGKDTSSKEFHAIFGERVPENDDLYHLLAQSDWNALPSFFLACGEQDSHYSQSVAMVEKLREKGAKAIFEHWNGIHGWDFWDEAVRRAFAVFFEG